MRNAGKKLMKKSGEVLSPGAQDSGPSSVPAVLLGDLRSLIESARIRVAGGVNAEMVLLYWDIGERVRKEILNDSRAAYGKHVVKILSDQLVMQYGTGFTRTNLFNMIRFAEIFPERTIIHTLCGQLSWSHFRLLIYIEDPLARGFYTEMCRLKTMECPDPPGKNPGDVVRTNCSFKKNRKNLPATNSQPSGTKTG